MKKQRKVPVGWRVMLPNEIVTRDCRFQRTDCEPEILDLLPTWCPASGSDIGLKVARCSTCFGTSNYFRYIKQIKTKTNENIHV
jgi:hypothetical protein